MDLRGHDIMSLPFGRVTYELMWHTQRGNAVCNAAVEELEVDGKALLVTDLAPGTYRVWAKTHPRKGKTNTFQDTEIDVGRFFSEKVVETTSGQQKHITLPYVAFDAEAFRGECEHYSPFRRWQTGCGETSPPPILRWTLWESRCA